MQRVLENNLTNSALLLTLANHIQEKKKKRKIESSAQKNTSITPNQFNMSRQLGKMPEREEKKQKNKKKNRCVEDQLWATAGGFG